MRYLTFAILWALHVVCFAQKQNNNWCFGYHGGLTFNTSPPTAFSSSTKNIENGASVSDKNTGKLLFYTDGVSVWDGTNTLMPNGTGVGTDNNTTSEQGSVIVPSLSIANKFYLFTVEEVSQAGTLRYSEIDMTLNSGKGDVVNTKKAISINDSNSEGITTIDGCGKYFLITLKRRNNLFFVYQITKAGLDVTPIISPTSYTNAPVGPTSIKISPDKKKLAVTVYSGTSNYSYVAIHDFDINTGIITNGKIIDSIAGTAFYGCEFSANSQMLYATNYSQRIVYQYNLTGSLATILASRQNIYTSSSSYIGSPQRGPDDNIYFPLRFETYLDILFNANAASPSCIYTHHAIALASSSETLLTLPQLVQYALPIGTHTRTDTTVCDKFSIIRPKQKAEDYLWQDGSTADSFIVRTTGTYWVKSILSCGDGIDSFVINFTNLDNAYPSDTFLCYGNILKLSRNIPGASYLWQDGDTGSVYTITKPGMYSVTVSANSCTKQFKINVHGKGLPISLGNDTVLCPNTLLTLNVPDTVTTYKWSTGETSRSLKVRSGGTYWLTINMQGCISSDTIDITYPAVIPNLGPDVTLCNTETLPLTPISFPDSKYHWQDGSNRPTFTVYKAGLYWVRADNVCGEYSDTIIIDYENCECTPFIPSAFSPNNDGLNDKLAPILNCNTSTYNFRIVNRFGQSVFEANDPMARWDGSFNGNPCEMGTYYYFLKLTGPRNKSFFFKGDITLLR